MAVSKKHFIVLGLGAFGTTLARRLAKNGCRVTGVDESRERVEALKDVLFEPVIGDATDRETLAQLAIETCDTVVVSLGGTIAPSLLATLHAKEQGAKRLVVKGIDGDHGRLLQHLGVDQIIYPKIDVANHLGDQLTWPNILDYVAIDPEYSFVEFAVPEDWVGKTLVDLDLRRKLGIWVIGMKDSLTSQLTMFPSGDVQLNGKQMLLVVGKQGEMEQLGE